MVRGFLARMGLDNRAFLRGMDEVERVTDETTQRMARRHRTQIDDMKRRERAQDRRRAKMQQDFARGWQVATVAAAAGIAAVVTSLDAAAERNPVIAQQLGQISSAAREMRANIGEDIFGLGGSKVDDAIRKFEELRGTVVDFVAVTRMGASASEVAAVNAARAADRQVAIALRQARNFNQVQLELRSAIGGDSDARAMLMGRRDNQMINSAAQDAGLTRTQVQELRMLVSMLRVTERTNRSRSFLQDERQGINLRRAQLAADSEAQRNPLSTASRERVVHLEREIELRKEKRRIDQMDFLTETQRVELLQETSRLIGEQSRARIEAIRNAARERIRAARVRTSDHLANDQIGMLRANNQSRLAEVESLMLGFTQRRRDIENDRDLSGAQRRSLLESGAGLLRAQLERLRRGGIDTVIEAGLAGGATLRRQILGAGGRDDSQSPVISRIDQIIEKMDVIISGGTAGVAVAAP